MFGSIDYLALTLYACAVTAFAVGTNTAWVKSAEGFASSGVAMLIITAVCWALFVFSIGLAAFIRIVERGGWL